MKSRLVILIVFAVACHRDARPQIAARSVAIPDGARVAVFSTTNEQLRGRVESVLLRERKQTTFVSRGEQDAILAEKALQTSGDFSDHAMVSLGQQLGATLLVVAREDNRVIDERAPMTGHCGIHLNAIDVESGVIQGFAQVEVTAAATPSCVTIDEICDDAKPKTRDCHIVDIDCVCRVGVEQAVSALFHS